LIFTVNVIKTILSFTWEVIKSILIIGATIGGIVAVLNFGAVLAGIAAIIAVGFILKKIFQGIWWVISSIAKTVWDIVTNPMRVFVGIAMFVKNAFFQVLDIISKVFQWIKNTVIFISSVLSKVFEGITFLFNVAAFSAFKLLALPLLPFLSVILGIVTAIRLFTFAFKSNFLGIRDLVYGIGLAFKKFFSDLIWGFLSVVGSVFSVFHQEMKSITNVFGELVDVVISIFDPILKLFNVDVSNAVLFVSGLLSLLVNIILVPVKIIAKSISLLIKGISWGIQSIIKGLIFVVQVVKITLSFIGKLLESILIIGATIGGIFAILNFGAVLAGIVSAFATIAGLIGSISVIVSGIISGIVFVTPFLITGVASVLTMIGGTIAGIAIALLPYLPIILLISGVCAAILGIAFVIKKIFEGILWVITSIAKVIWDIVTNPMKFLANVATFIQNIFSGITGAISGLFNAIKGVGSLLGSMFSKIGQGINTVVGWIMAPVSLLVNSISSLFSLLSNPLGFLSNIPIIGRFFGGQPKTEKPPGYATGGLVKGAGTRTGDRIHAKLSPGEYVINAIAAKANLPLLHSINAARAGMMPTPQIMAMPAFAPIPFFPPTQSESAGEQEININLNFGDIIVQGETGEDVYRDFLNKLRSPQAKMEIRQIMREFVERMR
jgi:phage-related protein